MTNSQEQVQFPTEEQASLESLMISLGIKRYEEKTNKEHQHGQISKAELRLLEGAVGAVAAAIEAHLNDIIEERKANGGRGRVAGYVFPLSLLDPKVLAFATLNECFVRVMRQESELKILLGIGRAIETELWAKNFHEAKPDVFERIVKLACKNHSRRDYRMTTVTNVAHKENFEVPAWDESYCLTVGSALLNAVLQSTFFFETYETEEGMNNTIKHVGFTREATDLMSQMNLEAALLRPVFLPMLQPTKPWTSFNSGCYHDPRLSRRVPLVRTYDRNHKKTLKEACANGQMTPVMQALTSMGNVPLSMNEAVLNVLIYVMENKVDIEGIPPWEHYIVPPKVHPVRWRIMPKEEKKRWKKHLQEIKIKNRALDCHWKTLKTEIGIANDLRGKTFYQGYSVDKRGRVYAVSSLNHMRADHIRNLFQFAEGKPLGATGVPWLAIHVASTGDFDKISKTAFVDRVKWTEENTEWLEAVGNDPIGNIDKWTKADKPFGFLAACIAWAGYKREGTSYICHLPIPLDGSNSGLQHYCAALRSEEGVLVNLKHGPKPQDIYASVAEKCHNKATQDLSDPKFTEVAQAWLAYGIGRSEVKRSVMTFAYSSPMFGFSKQLMEDLMIPLRDKVLQLQGFQGSLEDKAEKAKEMKLLMDGQDAAHPFGNEDSQRDAASYMAKLIWNAVNSVVSKAAEGMKFLQDCAALLAHEGKPVNWTTPNGMPVQNMYEDYTRKEVQLFLYDRKVRVEDAEEWDKITKDGEGVLKRTQVIISTEPTGKVIKTKQKSTVSPNFIHSMDACHLQTTVNYAVEAGITDLLLIHDSFSTHACDTSRFQMIIKQAFVDMYENNDVFAQFHQRVLEDISPANRDKVPTPPAKGTLDLQEVLKSDYAFS